MDKKSTPKSAEDLRRALAALDAAGEESAAATGRLTARTRLLSLFDEGSFVETQKYLRRSATEFDSAATDDFEGVLCGYGSVEGRLVFAFSQDFSRMKGALDAAHAAKICALYDLALKNGAPVVGMFDSAGACILEGAAALSGYGKIMKCVSRASGIIPQIAFIPGVCAGTSAATAAMFDAVFFSEKNGRLFVNAPFLVGDKAAGSALAAGEGLISVTGAEEADTLLSLRRFITLLPQNNAEGTVYTGATLENTQSAVSAYDGDVTALIASLADDADFFALSDASAGELITGLARMGGAVVGVLANNPAVRDGALTPAAARKAAHFVSFCDSFNLPLLTLVDTSGLDVTLEAESATYAAELAKLAAAVSSSENAKVTVVLGRAYGAAYTLMASASLGADMVLALDSAKIGVMPAESAVEFAQKDKILSAAAPQEKRSELEAEWNATLSSPATAAAQGAVDDVITADELKTRICSAFEMLSAKSESPLYRRHSNYPL